MAKLEFDSTGALHLPLQQLFVDGASAFVTLPNRPPPGAEHNRRTHEVGRRSLAVAKVLEAVFAAPLQRAALSQHDQALKDGFRELIYALAEYGEFLEKIPDIAPGAERKAAKDYTTGVKSRIRSPKLACNALKHGGNRLVVFSHTFANGSVDPGIALFQYQGELITPNPNLHSPDTVGFSAALFLKELLSDFLAAEETAARFCRRLVNGEPTIATGDGAKTLLEALHLAEGLPESGLGDERAHQIKTVRVSPGSVEYGKLPRRDSPPFGDVQVGFFFEGDGHTRSFQIAPTNKTGKI